MRLLGDWSPTQASSVWGLSLDCNLDVYANFEKEVSLYTAQITKQFVVVGNKKSSPSDPPSSSNCRYVVVMPSYRFFLRSP